MWGGGYKPLIATSLLFALGMSEVSADGGIWLRESGDIEEKTIDKTVEFQVDGIVGILVEPDSPKEIVATLKGDVTITSRALQDISRNRYGIFVDNKKTSLKSDDSVFRIITIEEITSSETDREAYVFKNARSGEVEFTKVGLVSGEIKEDCTVFGICNTVDAGYWFGGGSSKVGTYFTIAGIGGEPVAIQMWMEIWDLKCQSLEFILAQEKMVYQLPWGESLA